MFSSFLRKLQLENKRNENHLIDSKSKSNGFNELEILQMIPMIIKKLKNNKLNEREQSLLRTTFGDLWQLIDADAKRSSTDKMNPILKALLRSDEMQMSKTETEKLNNDIFHNTVEKVVRKHHFKANDRIPARLIKLRMKENMAPAQRLLKVAAILIHESMTKKSNSKNNQVRSKSSSQKNKRRRNRIQKKQLASNENKKRINNDSDLPANAVLNLNFHTTDKVVTSSSTMRTKRSLKYFDSGENEEVELNMLKSLIEPNVDTEFEDDDYNYDDKETSNDYYFQPKDQLKQTNQLKREQQAEQLTFINNDDYKDYAFDTTDTDHFNEDEDLLRRYYGQTRRSAYDDYEYGSASDLMQLATKHTLRSERDNEYLNLLRSEDYLSDYNAEDYAS